MENHGRSSRSSPSRRPRDSPTRASKRAKTKAPGSDSGVAQAVAAEPTPAASAPSTAAAPAASVGASASATPPVPSSTGAVSLRRRTRAGAAASGLPSASATASPSEASPASRKRTSRAREASEVASAAQDDDSGAAAAAATASASAPPARKGRHARRGRHGHNHSHSHRRGNMSDDRERRERQEREMHENLATLAAMFGREDDDEDPDEEEDDDMDAGDDDHGNPFSSFLARLADHRMGGMGAMGGGGPYDRLLRGLHSDKPYERQAALDEVSQTLLMGTEETLQGFRPEPFVTVLSNILETEENAQMAICACRSLTNMLEAIPSSSSLVARCAPTLCAKLLNIEYIDLAEQALTCLVKLSALQGAEVLHAGGMAAVLTFVDFFPITSQRDAVATAARIAPHVDVDSLHQVEGVIPTLTNFISASTDKSILENACLCFLNLAEALCATPEALRVLASAGFLEKAVAVLTATPSPLGPTQFSMLLTSLALMARASPDAGKDMLQTRSFEALNTLLRQGTAAATVETGAADPVAAVTVAVGAATGAPVIPQQSATGGLAFALTSHQLTDIMHLYANLLPPLPAALPFRHHMDKEYGPQPHVKWEFQDGGRWRAYPKAVCQQLESARAAGRPHAAIVSAGRHYLVRLGEMQQISVETQSRRRVRRGHGSSRRRRQAATTATGPDPRAEALAANPALLDDLMQASTKLLFDVYLSSAYTPLRHAFLEVLLRILHPASDLQLQNMLGDVSISSYLKEMLSHCQDDILALGALTTVEVLMTKLPSVFEPLLRRKGVAQAVVAISKSAIDETAEHDANNGEAAVGQQGSARPAGQRASPSPSNNGRNRAAAGSAAAASASSPAAGNPGNDEKPRRLASVVKLAQALVQQHFADVAAGDVSHPAFATLRHLQAVAAAIGKAVAEHDPEALDAPLVQLCRVLVEEGDGVTAYECVESGLMDALCSLLPPQSSGEQTASAGTARPVPLAAAFSRHVVEGDPQVTPALVSLLHAVLNISDKLPTTPLDDASDPKVALANSIKLRLERHPSEKRLQDFPSQMVLIDPLAPIQAIEDFLWPRVRPSKEGNDRKRLLEQLRRRHRSTDGAAGGDGGGEAAAAGSHRGSRRGSARSSASRSPSKSSASAAASGDAATDATSGGAAEGDSAQRRAQDEDEQDDMEGDAVDDEEEEEEEGGGSRRSSREVHEIRLSPPGTEWWKQGPSQAPTTKRRLEVVLNGNVLPSHITIYQAIQTYGDREAEGGAEAAAAAAAAAGPLGLMRLGSQAGVAVVRFRRARKAAATPSRPASRSRATHSLCRDESSLPIAEGSVTGVTDTSEDPGSIPPPPLTAEELALPRSVDAKLLREGGLLPAMVLLRALRAMCRARGLVQGNEGPVPAALFVNHRLAAKVTLEVCNFRAVSAGTFPQWCRAVVHACPFLLTFEQRRRFFLYTSFGAARALQHYKAENQLDATPGEDQGRFRLSRTKVRVDRERLLESAYHVLRQHGRSPTVLEVEFRGEVGTGLGPTLEFFALVSREFQRASLGMWLDTEMGAHEYARAPGGLYPRPIRTPSAKDLTLFELLGCLVAKALEDGRVLDLHFSPAFLMWMGGEYPSTLADLATIDPGLATSLDRVGRFARAAQAILAEGLPKEEADARLAEVRVDDATLDDFCLTFELPGQAGYELCEDGATREVTMYNVAEYYDRCLHTFLVGGVEEQMECFLRGLRMLVPEQALAIFELDELDTLVRGIKDEAWSVGHLRSAVKVDHGFTLESQAVVDLLHVMSQLDKEERRLFSMFLTGSPNLPVGGFAKLTPPFTVVRKESADHPADHVLPSVMTCQNYLKLPAYSTRDILADKLRLAIREGQGSFHLS